MDLQATLNEPVIKGGWIDVKIDGVISTHELGSWGTTDCYFLGGLDPVTASKGVTCWWVMENGANYSDIIRIADFKAATNPTISFRVHGNITHGNCEVGRVTSYSDKSNKIVENEKDIISTS